MSPGEFSVGETSISTRLPELQFRGYRADDLAAGAQFPEVAYLLMEGELPSQEQSADLEAVLIEEGNLEPELQEFLSTLPCHVDLLDAMRTAVCLLANTDAQANDHSGPANQEKAFRLLAKMPIILAAAYRGMRGDESPESRPDLSYAANIFWLLTGEEPDADEELALETLLIVSAEHELEPSTITARMAATAQANLYSAVIGALGIFRGEYSERDIAAMGDLLVQADSPEKARDRLVKLWDQKARLPGFDSRAYLHNDPRVTILREQVEILARREPDSGLETAAANLERAALEVCELRPHLLWPALRLVRHLGLLPELTVPLMAVGRLAGWIAHFNEQLRSNSRLRGTARYVGPVDLQFMPLTDRG